MTKQPDWWSVSVTCSVIQQRENQSFESLLVMGQWSIFSLTLVSDQLWSGNTPAYPRYYLLAKCWAVSSGICWLYCRWTFWNVDVQLTPNSVPQWKAFNRPSGECPTHLSNGVILLHDNAWPNTAQPTWNLLQNFGSEMLDHTVQIWHPSILYISHLEWALITTLFYNWWRHQACYYHIKFRASWMDELTARCDSCLDLQVNYVKK